MPRSEPPSLVGEVLRVQLELTGQSARSLAQRMHKLAPTRSVETYRRQIEKIKSGDTKRPKPGTTALIAAGLNVDPAVFTDARVASETLLGPVVRMLEEIQVAVRDLEARLAVVEGRRPAGRRRSGAQKAPSGVPQVRAE